MIIKNIQLIKQRIIDRGQSIYDLGKDIIEAGVKVYKERNESEPQVKKEKGETLRKNLRDNFTVSEKEDTKEMAKQISLKSHKLKAHPVSGENWNSNMGHRNFNNHQGN